MAQLIGLNEDPDDAFPPFEAQMRRRLWWHICGLESRGAEEGGARQTSIMEDCHVQLPSNLNDFDLKRSSADRVRPRTGVTDMTFVLLRWDSVRLVHSLMEIKKRHKSGRRDIEAASLKEQQNKALEESKLRFQTNYLRHLDESRPYDWLCIRWSELILVRNQCISINDSTNSVRRSKPDSL